MILVLGGTSDATLLAKALYALTDKVFLSTATEYGSRAAEKDFPGEIIWGRKDGTALLRILEERRIRVLVDATHPFAGDISENAIKACGQAGIAYIRYERPASALEGENIVLCDSYEQAGEIAEGLPGTVFITTGSRHAGSILKNLRDRSRARLRVLPVSESLLALEALGLRAEQIIAMKGPFSEEMNYLMMKECNARVMICKDSGARGGTPEKLRAAERLGIKALVIGRPAVAYPNQYQNIEAVVAAVSELV